LKVIDSGRRFDDANGSQSALSELASLFVYLDPSAGVEVILK
jgi:hypothetical protein